MLDKSSLFSELLNKIIEISGSPQNRDQKLQIICNLIMKTLPTYDWVGFYLVDPDRDRELILGPYAGEPTEHIRISFGQGICGQAAEKMKPVIIDNVSKEKNYLSCNIEVKSEIVLPVFKRDELIGEIDVDSHTAEAFDRNDEMFLTEVCKVVSGLF